MVYAKKGLYSPQKLKKKKLQNLLNIRKKKTEAPKIKVGSSIFPHELDFKKLGLFTEAVGKFNKVKNYTKVKNRMGTNGEITVIELFGMKFNLKNRKKNSFKTSFFGPVSNIDLLYTL